MEPGRITILGTGNAAITAAYHFGCRGAEVCLYGAPGFEAPIHAIRKAGGIRALDRLGDTSLLEPGFQTVPLLATDIADAVGFSELLLMPVPSFAQEPLFRLMLPHLHDRHVLFLMPGNFGSLALTKLKNELGYSRLRLTFLEAISIPWACRVTGEAELAIFGLKKFLPVAALPAWRTAGLAETVGRVFPVPLQPLVNVLAAGLENINFGGHPLLTVLSIGLLENFPGRFNYYRDCCSPSTARAAAAMDDERLAIGAAMNIPLVPELAAMNGLYGLDAASVYEFNRGSPTHGAIQGAPDSARHRYISEDVPYLLVPCAGLARLANTPTPVLDACICLAGALNGENYLQTGRTLDRMGLSDLNLHEVLEYVTRGDQT